MISVNEKKNEMLTSKKIMSFGDLAIIILAHKEQLKIKMEREAKAKEGKERPILNLENITEDSQMEEEEQEEKLLVDQVKEIDLSPSEIPEELREEESPK